MNADQTFVKPSRVMSKLFQKVKDAMTNRQSKSKRLSRDSDSWSDGSEYNTAGGAGDSSSYAPYRTTDYGSRFESHGTPRPGTYGSGDYGSNGRSTRYVEYAYPRDGSNYGNTAYVHVPKPGTYGSGREFSNSGSNSLRAERSAFQDGWRYSYSSGNRMGSMPVDRAQRSQW